MTTSGDTRGRTLRRIALRPVHRWGASFAATDLTGANFAGADASRSELQGAIVAADRWDPEQASMVDVPDFEAAENAGPTLDGWRR